MEKFLELFAYFNPMYFYYAIIYGVSKIYQNIFDTESVWKIIWNKIMDTFGESEGFYIIWFLNLYSFFLYWTLGALLLTMQKLKIPKSLENFKIQTKESEIEKRENLLNVIKVVTKNQFVVLILSIIFYYGFDNWIAIKVSRDLPSFPVVMRDLFVCFFCNEIFFYYTHRLLHYRRFYFLHKQHHEFITPACIASQYAGTIEHLVSNIFPVGIGFKILKCHVTTAILWLTVVLVTTLNDHSGYHLPFLHSSELHDYHHLKFNVNYSVYGIWDVLHGTYGHFRKSKNYKNHRTLLSFSPVKK